MLGLTRGRGRLAGVRMTAVGVVAAAAVGVFALVTPQARAASHRPLTSSETCAVQAVPSSLVELSTNGSAAAIVDVACAAYAGKSFQLESAQIYARCENHLTWSAPYPYAPSSGSSFKVQLDSKGNATVVLWAGPGCIPGRSLIAAELEEPPYITLTTEFAILPPQVTAPGLTLLPSNVVENSTHSSVASILQLEFPPEYAASRVVYVASDQLFAHCLAAPHLVWVGPDGTVLGNGTESAEVQSWTTTAAPSWPSSAARRAKPAPACSKPT